MPRQNWTRNELIVAFNLYCRTPFGRIHNRNPSIVALAKAIGRTPSALSWKLANFSRLDPAVTGRNLSGATHGSNLEKEIWDEFNGDWDRLVFESENLTAEFFAQPIEVLFREDFPEGRDRDSNVKVRVNQSFFRAAVLAAYDSKCCITGLAIPELLNASHIVPWRIDVKNRTNPRNGLCLNALHDKAFDCGFISIGLDFRVMVSPSISRVVNDAFGNLILRYEGVEIALPQHFRPDPLFLAHHNQVVFRDK